MGNQSEFQRQRKEAQRARFDHCDVVGISWSEEELQFNNFKTEPI